MDTHAGPKGVKISLALCERASERDDDLGVTRRRGRQTHRPTDGHTDASLFVALRRSSRSILRHEASSREKRGTG